MQQFDNEIIVSALNLIAIKYNQVGYQMFFI